jgi:ABC-2 type transport system permease protein
LRRAFAILRREFRASFESPIAYVTTALFVLLLDGTFFFLGFPVGPLPLPSLWEGGQATLLGLFTWLPLLLAFFVPALTMGAWADERRSGTEELLLTHPVRSLEIVLGKFLAAWILVGLFVSCAVFPVAITVGQLGDLDWSTVIVGLGGALALAAAYVALSLCISATTREPLVAFLLGAILLLLLWAARMLVSVLPAGLAAALDYVSPLAHFLDSAARGVLDLRDPIYFGSIVFAGLVSNVILVERRRWS